MPNRVVKIIINGLKPDPNINFLDWANKEFYLPKESSAEYGKYRTSRTPFVEEILLALSPQSETQVVIVIKPTQLAGTTTGLIFMCAVAAMYPGPLLMIMPTDAMAKSFSKKKLTNTIKLIPSLKDKIKEAKSRDSGNTILEKEFPGGSWKLTGSNSGASYRSESIKYLIIDDFDGFEIDIEGEGSPEELADRRTGTFPGRKIYINSTTTIKDSSNIEIAFEKSSQGYYHVPCPHCNKYQYLSWGDVKAEFGIRFERDEHGMITDCWYQCEHCKQRIDESSKPDMLSKGKYIHKFPERKAKGFKYNALYTPLGWVNSWKYIAEKFIESSHELKKGNAEKYKTWLNSFMSEPFEQLGDRPDWARLKARCEQYQPLTVPAGAKILTAGVDVHPDRLICSIWGWGKGEEAWLIYHVEIVGDVMQDDVWNQLDLLINRPFKNDAGIIFQVLSIGVDAGDGNTTQAVRNYCRFRAPKVFALKGASTAGKPVIGIPTKQDITWKGEKIENGIELWQIGTDTAKSTLYTRLNINENGAGKIHFYIGLEDEYFEQLTAEKLVTRFVKGYPVREWHNVRGNKRNEALDCFIYAYASGIRIGISYIDFDRLITTQQEKPKPKVVQQEKEELRERTFYNRPSWLNR